MSDIHFECPKCNQTLDAPEELATQLIDCPTCKQTIEVPVRSHAPPPPISKPTTPPKDSEIKPSGPPPISPHLASLAATPRQEPIHVIVKDFEMSFGSMVVFMIKWALAAIPALIILTVIGFFIVIVFSIMNR